MAADFYLSENPSWDQCKQLPFTFINIYLPYLPSFVELLDKRIPINKMVIPMILKSWTTIIWARDVVARTPSELRFYRNEHGNLRTDAVHQSWIPIQIFRYMMYLAPNMDLLKFTRFTLCIILRFLSFCYQRRTNQPKLGNWKLLLIILFMIISELTLKAYKLVFILRVV